MYTDINGIVFNLHTLDVSVLDAHLKPLKALVYFFYAYASAYAQSFA